MKQNRTTEFVLGLIGSILGLIGSLFWILIGTSFWQGFIGSFHPHMQLNDITGLAFLIAVAHSMISIACYILTLIKSISVKNDPRKSGVWLLTLGILTIVINAFSLVPGILIIIAGSLALTGNKKQDQENQTEAM